MRTTLAVQGIRVVAFVLASLIAMSPGMACSIRATDMRWLNRESDIIAVGVIHIVREKVENAGNFEEESVTGLARLEVQRYVRYRDVRTPWIEFPYHQYYEEACGFHIGLRPEGGARVKIWFTREGDRLAVLRMERLDEPEQSEQDEE